MFDGSRRSWCCRGVPKNYRPSWNRAEPNHWTSCVCWPRPSLCAAGRLGQSENRVSGLLHSLEGLRLRYPRAEASPSRIREASSGPLARGTRNSVNQTRFAGQHRAAPCLRSVCFLYDVFCYLRTLHIRATCPHIRHYITPYPLPTLHHACQATFPESCGPARLV
jgi:hypothetical protein